MRVGNPVSYSISGYPKQARAILKAMKSYGMIVADNGSDWYFSGAPEQRWEDDAFNTVKAVQGSVFEVVRMGAVSHR